MLKGKSLFQVEKEKEFALNKINGVVELGKQQVSLEEGQIYCGALKK